MNRPGADTAVHQWRSVQDELELAKNLLCRSTCQAGGGGGAPRARKARMGELNLPGLGLHVPGWGSSTRQDGEAPYARMGSSTCQDGELDAPGWGSSTRQDGEAPHARMGSSTCQDGGAPRARMGELHAPGWGGVHAPGWEAPHARMGNSTCQDGGAPRARMGELYAPGWGGGPRARMGSSTRFMCQGGELHVPG